MATPLSDHCIYIIDNNSQDWLHDPETIDLDNYTEGTDYIVFTIPQGFNCKQQAQWNEEDFPGGSGFAVPIEERAVLTKFGALLPLSSKATVKLIQNFFDTHTNTSDEDLYLIIRHTSNNYEEYTDSVANSRARREYCKGIFKEFTLEYLDEELMYEMQGLFRSLW